jgi:hypothetical protein
MKKLIRFLSVAGIVFLITAGHCRKKNVGGGNTIDIETIPASGSTQTPSVGPLFSLIVNIKSAMPSGGVRIDVLARPDGSPTPYYTNSITTTNTTNNFTIDNTPLAVICTVEITVTSITNASEKATASYKYARK